MSRSLPALLLVLGCGENPDVPPIDPGTVTLHRLNRAEYDHTVRDLFGTPSTPAADFFPADDFGDGFSNQAEVLSLSPLHIELLERAADLLLEEISLEREMPETTIYATVPGGSAELWSGAERAVTAEVTETGTWQIAPIATTLAGGTVELVVSGETLSWSIADSLAPIEIALAAGPLAVVMRAPDALVTATGVSLYGPLDLPIPPSPGRDAIFTCDPTPDEEASCAEEIVRGFTRRAWRRPPTPYEHTQMMGLYAASRNSAGPWEEGVLLALKGVLVSPYFVYRVESDPSMRGVARPLDGYELASRLSYFLWASTPDETLLTLAAEGSLVYPDVIEGQVARMLADERAEGLVDTLGVEWLYLDAVDDAAPDEVTFPTFDEGLRAAMREEMHRFVGAILLGGRPMTELLDGRDTFANPVLASHYGVPAPSPDGFAPIHLEGDRVGLYGRAGWLTAVSYPTRTSPVRRGKWVLENLLCESPPPPPDDVPALGDSFPETGAVPSVQEQLAAHREDPSCMSCHVVMDGIGFGLEHFDAFGRWRETDEYGAPIVASGVLTDGSAFDGTEQLAAELARSETVTRCMVQKVFTYALGRAPRVEDLPALDEIHAEFRAQDTRFDALAAAIATSDAFRFRAAEAGR